MLNYFTIIIMEVYDIFVLQSTKRQTVKLYIYIYKCKA